MDGDPAGTVDINDLTIVLANFGTTYGASPAGIAAVPEPSSASLIGAAVLGLVAGACRRRARKRGQAPFAGTARRVLRTNGACPLFPVALRPPRLIIPLPDLLAGHEHEQGRRARAERMDSAQRCQATQPCDQNPSSVGGGEVETEFAQQRGQDEPRARR